jgi:hypothetical protein
MNVRAAILGRMDPRRRDHALMFVIMFENIFVGAGAAKKISRGARRRSCGAQLLGR